MYKLVISDMDGTLLNDEHNINDYNINSIESLKSRNIPFVYATGRIIAEVRRYYKDYGIGDYLIGANGGLVLDMRHDNILYEKVLTKNEIAKIIEIIDDNYNMFLFAGRDYYRGICFSGMDPVNAPFFKPFTSLNEILESKNNHIYYLEIVTKHGKVTDLVEKIKKEVGNLHIFSMQFANDDGASLIILPQNCSKGMALDFLLKYLGINRSEAVAFGDSINDIELLKASGYSVAMSNGKEVVKQISNEIVENNDSNGVGRWINDNVLQLKRR
jgi:Cof subfamily protein (haloacid dehalogenase superfamily)